MVKDPGKTYARRESEAEELRYLKENFANVDYPGGSPYRPQYHPQEEEQPAKKWGRRAAKVVGAGLLAGGAALAGAGTLGAVHGMMTRDRSQHGFAMAGLKGIKKGILSPYQTFKAADLKASNHLQDIWDEAMKP